MFDFDVVTGPAGQHATDKTDPKDPSPKDSSAKDAPLADEVRINAENAASR